ncbi:MAG: aconitate hydratase AcnA [Acidobacteria bacterium]|nr:aconitate hydratase AcnA [Acidobacteriota bacterium]
MSTNTFGTRQSLPDGHGGHVDLYSLRALEASGYPGVGRLPYSLKILLENLLRREDGRSVTAADVEALARWTPGARKEIAFMPARVLLQDFTGVPAVVDLAAMRDGVARLGGDPARVNPLQPAELVIDHSVQVDHFGVANALELNARLEFARNRERYAFLKWGQDAFRNFKVVPPDTGIVHQVNIEHLARVVCRDETDGNPLAYPDTLVGTDSHTTMVNGLGVVGWGVGGIEAEAAMLGQPISMLIPDVVGLRLVGSLPEGTTATDLVLTITERLRRHGVVGKFVEFFGPGLGSLSLADRATLGNMSPEYGSTVAICPIDGMTLDYLALTGREAAQVDLVEAYAKAQGLFASEADDPVYSDVVELDLATVEPSIAGPRRPQDRVPLRGAGKAFETVLGEMTAGRPAGAAPQAADSASQAEPGDAGLRDGAVVIAAITSCTNTSNPSVMIAAGLVARKAAARRLRPKPWVKTSLAPGSMVVTEYLAAAGLLEPLAELGFGLVGYGCTTCIGNSGPLPEEVARAVRERDLVVTSVLSGNRNFEGRVQPLVRANYLASPPLVVAYALAGRMTIDLTAEPLGRDADGNDVHLADLWPSADEVQQAMASAVRTEHFTSRYSQVFHGDERWRSLPAPAGEQFGWTNESTYVRHPPFFETLTPSPAPPADVVGARVLALLGDSVTTDHISPAGTIPPDGPAGRYLIENGVDPGDFNSFGSRRGNHEVMMRGTFANIRLRNRLAPGTEGGWTRHLPDGEQMAIYDAAMRYKAEGTPLVVLAGAEYGSGSSRDWAAKGTMLLGVRAVIATSFERIHRSNLVFMGVLPLVFRDGDDVERLGLTGEESFDLSGIAEGLAPRSAVRVRATRPDGAAVEFDVTARIDTPEELRYYHHGGILPYVLRQLAAA